MDFLIEFILELLIDCGIEVTTDKNTSPILRKSVGVILILFLSGVILGIFILGVAIVKKDLYAGLFIILVGIILLVGGFYRFKEIYRKKKF